MGRVFAELAFETGEPTDSGFELQLAARQLRTMDGLRGRTLPVKRPLPTVHPKDAPITPPSPGQRRPTTPQRQG